MFDVDARRAPATTTVRGGRRCDEPRPQQMLSNPRRPPVSRGIDRLGRLTDVGDVTPGVEIPTLKRARRCPASISAICLAKLEVTYEDDWRGPA